MPATTFEICYQNHGTMKIPKQRNVTERSVTVFMLKVIKRYILDNFFQGQL